MTEQLTFFLFAFTSLFTIVNPFGAMPVFMSMTEGLEPERVRELARKASVTAGFVMLAFALTGEMIFSLFDISVDGLRIVGGVLFFIMGYEMLQGSAVRSKTLSREELEGVEGTAITPLAVPLICGPGAITVTTVLMKESTSFTPRSIVILTIFVVTLATYFFLVGSQRIMALLGKSGNRVFSRLMGIIIMMIAVEFFFRGLRPYVKALITTE